MYCRPRPRLLPQVTEKSAIRAFLGDPNYRNASTANIPSRLHTEPRITWSVSRSPSAITAKITANIGEVLIRRTTTPGDAFPSAKTNDSALNAKSRADTVRRISLPLKTRLILVDGTSMLSTRKRADGTRMRIIAAGSGRVSSRPTTVVIKPPAQSREVATARDIAI